jgi:hypothetical protein
MEFGHGVLIIPEVTGGNGKAFALDSENDLGRKFWRQELEKALWNVNSLLDWATNMDGH